MQWKENVQIEQKDMKWKANISFHHTIPSLGFTPQGKKHFINFIIYKIIYKFYKKNPSLFLKVLAF